MHFKTHIWRKTTQPEWFFNVEIITITILVGLPYMSFVEMYLCVCLVAQSCPILCDPMDCSLPGSSVRGIFQSRILEWVAFSFYRRSSWPRDWTRVSRMVGRRFTIWATREVRWQVGINPRQVSAVSRMRSPRNHRAGLLTCFTQDISFIHISTL